MDRLFRLSQRALEDLDSIWSYIASDGVDAANRVERAILASCEKLGRFPMLGAKRTDITARPVRFWTVARFPNFIVVYRHDVSPIHVLTIIHGMRDLKQVLSDPGIE
jgi:plasmid stabilization system protein ParE